MRVAAEDEAGPGARTAKNHVWRMGQKNHKTVIWHSSQDGIQARMTAHVGIPARKPYTWADALRRIVENHNPFLRELPHHWLKVVIARDRVSGHSPPHCVHDYGRSLESYIRGPARLPEITGDNQEVGRQTRKHLRDLPVSPEIGTRVQIRNLENCETPRSRRKALVPHNNPFQANTPALDYAITQ